MDKAIGSALRPYYLVKHRRAPRYRNPTESELLDIEEELEKIGVKVEPYCIQMDALDRFKKQFAFPESYCRGKSSSLIEEKYLEHFLAYTLAGLVDFDRRCDIYVDVAASSSPWALMLRDRGYQAYAIDIDTGVSYNHLDYYMAMDAKETTFADASIKAMSLQCAYEMFLGEDDSLFLDECSRVLQPGGRVVIAPLYLDTEYCGYSTPEHFRKGYAAEGATEYLRSDSWGIPFSRKYSPAHLKTRILDRITQRGMGYRVYKIDNKGELPVTDHRAGRHLRERDIECLTPRRRG